MRETFRCDGIINLNKPVGCTSADCVAIVKKKLWQIFSNTQESLPNTEIATQSSSSTKKLIYPKVGHMGTLDPMGSGVLLIGVGKATRLFDWYLKHDKEYIADFVFGVEHDTLDCTGRIERTTTNIPTVSQVQSVISQFVGNISQIPPQYSAKKIGGERAYDLARQGKRATLQPCNVIVHDIKILQQLDDKTFKLKINCSSGTYIRSLGRDIALALGSLASMSYINRVRCGQFVLQDSVLLDDIKLSNIVPLEQSLPKLPRYDLCDSLMDSLLVGKKIYLDNPIDVPHILYCKGLLFGIGCTLIDGRLSINTRLL
ncbi:MAG: tRNA pseudouridine(55) synthase TruB [Firmicutes bacterium]|nr:tRNA pseudouridine(55) synthase TruB [Bacillota bacterium]MCL1954210.1 tRNA pseudouridine(55) synthase TruB [Bacillota bacterium]